jgi:crotonobetaine/carnitine-CoA ligase
MGTLVAGATLILLRRFSASQFWEQVQRYNATQFNFIGAMARMLYNQPLTPLDTAHGVRIACGAPVPVEIYADFERRFHLTVLETYGLSECPMGTSNLANMRKIGSMGKPARHPDPALYTRVRLVDDAERDVSVGQVGEVLLQSPALMVGYYRDLERTAEAMHGQWTQNRPHDPPDRASGRRLAGKEWKQGRGLALVGMGTGCRHTDNIHRGFWRGEGIIPLEELTTGTGVIDMRA